MIKRDMEPRNKGNTRYGKQTGEAIQQEVYHLLKESKTLKPFFEELQNETKRLNLLNKSAAEKEEDDDVDVDVDGKKKLFKRQQETHKFVNNQEIILNSLILDNPDLFQGIQRIYRNHGVDIPSQRTIDKGEVIEVKKKIVKENMQIVDK